MYIKTFNLYAEFLRNMLAICIIFTYYVRYHASYMYDTAAQFESSASHICDIVDYLFIYTSLLSIICSSIVVDYPYIYVYICTSEYV